MYNNVINVYTSVTRDIFQTFLPTVYRKISCFFYESKKFFASSILSNLKKKILEIQIQNTNVSKL